MKKNTKKIFLFSVLLTILFSSVALAADYIPLEPNAWSQLNGTGGKVTSISTTNLGDFLNKVFSFGIAIAVALTVVMITLGGIQYMTTDSWSKKDEGKQKVKDAFTGLALALISWLILYTINPCLVSFTSGTECAGGNKILETTK